MKLTREDKKQLIEWGHLEDDFPQIEQAMNNTFYMLGGKIISRKKAIELLGRTKYLSGISRSAFHFTAARETGDGQIVLFDSSKLFK